MSATTERIAAIRARLAAAAPNEDYAVGRTALTATPASAGKLAAIWYDDGDQAATVHDNLGLGIDGDAMACLLAAAPDDLRWVCDEAERLSERAEQAEATIEAMLAAAHSAKRIYAADGDNMRRVAEVVCEYVERAAKETP